MQRLIFIALIIVFCVSFKGLGDTETQQKSFWEAGPELFQSTYKEPGLMKQDGLMWGIFGSYTYRQQLVFKLEGSYSAAKMHYTGATWGGTPITDNKVHDFMWEFRGLTGNERMFHNVTTYTGLGYRYLNDNSSASGSYERESNYYYIPLGVEINNILNANEKRDWIVGAILEYDLFIGGKQISHLSDADPGFNDISNVQDGGYGYRLSLKLRKKSEQVDFVIEPFIRYWSIKESDSVPLNYYGTFCGYGVEPKNNTRELGIIFGLNF
jgi:hypothetical protein